MDLKLISKPAVKGIGMFLLVMGLQTCGRIYQQNRLKTIYELPLIEGTIIDIHQKEIKINSEIYALKYVKLVTTKQDTLSLMVGPYQKKTKNNYGIGLTIKFPPGNVTLETSYSSKLIEMQWETNYTGIEEIVNKEENRIELHP